MRDLSYLKDAPIAVLGAGAVGKTVAADCKLAGREVRLYSRSPRSLANLDKTGILLDGIQRNLYGFERSGKAMLDVATNDMAEAVKGANSSCSVFRRCPMRNISGLWFLFWRMEW